jgi:hypothetical protein
MSSVGSEKTDGLISMQGIAEELARASWIRNQMEEAMGEFNRLVPIDNDTSHEDMDGHNIDELEFLSGSPDDLIVRGKSSGKYYFHSDDLANLIGPYDTEEDARDAEQRYYEEIVLAQKEL